MAEFLLTRCYNLRVQCRGIIITNMVTTSIDHAPKGFSPSTDQEAVLGYMRPTLERLEALFIAGCDRTAEHIAARGWKRFDPNLFAHEVRKDVYEGLLLDGCEVETDDAEDNLKVESMSLCGLLLKKDLVHLRIRKSKDGEVPRADSGNLLEFYQSNLFSELAAPGETFPLKLMLLWDVDAQRRFKRFWLGCPQEDGIRWYWSKAIPLGGASVVEAIDLGKAFREAFEAENSDVPMTRTEGDPAKRSTGTNDKTGK
jgi:hypothetical protein